MAQAVKNLPAVHKPQVRSLSREDPLEREDPLDLFNFQDLTQNEANRTDETNTD